jgi:filamentous hemagglutinin
VDTTANGLPLVQITNPSAGGVSRNQFTRFDVDPGGLILNNSTTIASTQLAGYVPANPNLEAPARVILNEVTGGDPSRLLGYTEVAGQKAEVVIANQNGITCDGCGFINASRGTFTTGAPVFGGAGTLEAFRVTGGNITVSGAGLAAGDLEQVDLISRTASINAGLWAKTLNVITGTNQVGRAELSVTPLAPSGASPQVSLDVGLLGGMYAGKIRLIGTEKGVGVVSQGTLASSGEFTLSSEGHVVLGGKATSAGPLVVTTSGDVTSEGTLFSETSLDLSALGTVTNTGTAAAQGNVTIEADRIRSAGTVAAGVSKDGQVLPASQANARLEAYGGVDLSGGRLLATGSAGVQGARLNLAGATVESGGETSLVATAGDLLAAGATLDAGEDLFAWAAGTFAGQGASLLGQGVQVEAATIDLGGGAAVRSVGDAFLSARAGDLLGAGATLQAGGLFSAAAAGRLEGSGANVSAESVALGGGVLSLDFATVTSTGDQQLVSSAGDLGVSGATRPRGRTTRGSSRSTSPTQGTCPWLHRSCSSATARATPWPTPGTATSSARYGDHRLGL